MNKPCNRFFIAMAFGAATVAAPLHADVIDSSTAGFSLAFTRGLPVTADIAFQRLTADVHRWWLADHTWYGSSTNMSIDTKPNGCLCETNGEQFTEHLRVVKYEPGQAIRFTGGLGPLQGEGVNGVMDWSITPDSHDPQRSVLTVKYRVGGYTPNDLSQWANAVDNVLQQQMDSFQTYVSD
ncbi:SRPBCC family protein [Pseudidiomarina salilacus]|uniref:hypothetical protein n=1 Tax=Pseudidiomarina salilacus TaxID=3384452 RepID=UPI0039852573